ncbi:hypothetical protein ADUPG1_012116 [Aduncisulcus paluster]|uniref:Uncharacterized protein n=1 Tax=Aduncisulcus paluster TaxID=2918883 RepID=A0ABQ5K1L5_9EUKA|nr:hypothetical protein ADUPG1_012116 [Aduncisulcus paluster]
MDEVSSNSGSKSIERDKMPLSPSIDPLEQDLSILDASDFLSDLTAGPMSSPSGIVQHIPAVHLALKERYSKCLSADVWSSGLHKDGELLVSRIYKCKFNSWILIQDLRSPHRTHDVRFPAKNPIQPLIYADGNIAYFFESFGSQSHLRVYKCKISDLWQGKPPYLINVKYIKQGRSPVASSSTKQHIGIKNAMRPSIYSSQKSSKPYKPVLTRVTNSKSNVSHTTLVSPSNPSSIHRQPITAITRDSYLSRRTQARKSSSYVCSSVSYSSHRVSTSSTGPVKPLNLAVTPHHISFLPSCSLALFGCKQGVCVFDCTVERIRKISLPTKAWVYPLTPSLRDGMCVCAEIGSEKLKGWEVDVWSGSIKREYVDVHASMWITRTVSVRAARERYEKHQIEEKERKLLEHKNNPSSSLEDKKSTPLDKKSTTLDASDSLDASHSPPITPKTKKGTKHTTSTRTMYIMTDSGSSPSKSVSIPLHVSEHEETEEELVAGFSPSSRMSALWVSSGGSIIVPLPLFVSFPVLLTVPATHYSSPRNSFARSLMMQSFPLSCMVKSDEDLFTSDPRLYCNIQLDSSTISMTSYWELCQ